MICSLCKRDTKVIIANRLRSGEARDVYHCPVCDLGILQSDMTEEQYKEYYENEYRKFHKPVLGKTTNARQLFDLNVKFQHDRISLLKPFLNKKMKLLELGCSAGQFLHSVKPYVGQIYGYDLDKKALRFARRHVGCIEWDERKKGFDVICMFQVMEHVQEPLKYLEKIKQCLDPNGIVMVEVPNLKDSLIAAYDLPNHFQFYFHKAHLWYFTETSLKKLMRQAGFDGKIYFTQDYSMMNHMHWLINDKPQNSCEEGLSSPSLPLRISATKSLDAAKRSLDLFIKESDLRYKQLLIKHGISSNITFIGRISKAKR